MTSLYEQARCSVCADPIGGRKAGVWVEGEGAGFPSSVYFCDEHAGDLERRKWRYSYPGEMPRVLAGYRGEYKAAPPKKPEPQGAPKRHSENALTLAFLRENPGATAADIASHFQVTPEGAWKRLARLAYRKWVRHEGERGERRYWITEGAP